MNTYIHIPVLRDETLSTLDVKPGGLYVDGTFGRGGHTREILSRGGLVLGIDRDDAAIESSKPLLEQANGALRVVKGCHGNLKSIAEANGWNQVDGVLLDLGVSSPQLDAPERGFSFMRPGPLDMRMDQSCGLSAADLVNTADETELERIFREYGEEPQSRRLAKAIVARRGFETTLEFADFVVDTLGKHGPHHPATRAFQALRMAVNDELGELRRALDGALALLAPGGRLAVITFESLSDRIVKHHFADHVGREVSLQQGGSEWQGTLPRARNVFRHAVVATEKELSTNIRARSAKLRAIIKEGVSR